MNYKLLLPLCLLGATFSSQAEQRWFEVELLLFQRNTQIDAIKEDLTTESLQLDSSNSVPLLATPGSQLCTDNNAEPCLADKVPVLIDSAHFAGADNGFHYLPNNHLQLSAQRHKLEQHASFTPLLHVAWRMPVASRYSGKPIHLVAGQNFAYTAPIIASPATESELQAQYWQTQEITANAPSATATLSQKIPEQWTIDGNLHIYLDHYLYIDSQLIVRQQVSREVLVNKPQFDVINSDANVQVIKHHEQQAVQTQTLIEQTLFDQNRRMRSEEIHYFDHPLMGMIVQIRKIAETNE